MPCSIEHTPMRILAILILVVAFFVAVILPNEVGTHDLPATGAKLVLTKGHPLSAKLVKGGPAAFVTPVALQGDTALSQCGADSTRSVQIVSNRHVRLPLLI
jgi:hypothetical protein